MDIGKMIDAISTATKRTRQQYHLTLGQLIDALEKMPEYASVRLDDGKSTLCVPYSYRGYYEDLGFSTIACGDSGRSAGDLLRQCKGLIGRSFTGYKGGAFIMMEETALWVSEKGVASGMAITDCFVADGALILRTKHIA